MPGGINVRSGVIAEVQYEQVGSIPPVQAGAVVELHRRNADWQRRIDAKAMR